MKLQLTFASGLLATSVAGAAIERRQSGQADANQIITAVLDWRGDTGFVSNFLNKAQAHEYDSTQDFQAAALAAHKHESNEAFHKAVLDHDLPADSALQLANFTLVGEGTVARILDLLLHLSTLDYDTQQLQIQRDLYAISFGRNFPGRCNAVLPAITAYYQQASDYVGLDGSNELIGVTPVYETACGAIAEVQWGRGR